MCYQLARFGPFSGRGNFVTTAQALKRFGATWVRLIAAASIAAWSGLTIAPAIAASLKAGIDAYDAGDYATAYKEWLPLAQDGDAAAQRNVGNLYRLGQGVKQDLAEAVNWYRRSAGAGFDRAQTNLAVMLMNGEGVEKNYEEALKLFEKAGLQGNAVAQYNAGVLYELGLGAQKSTARAVGWYNLAAKAGHPGALDRLSYLVALRPAEEALGESGAKAAATLQPPTPAAPTNASTKTATTAIQQAAAPAERKPEFKELLTAAQSGSATAQYLVGLTYRDGQDGVPADKVRAFAWLALAVKNGHPVAGTAKDSLETRLTPDQVSAAKALDLGIGKP